MTASSSVGHGSSSSEVSCVTNDTSDVTKTEETAESDAMRGCSVVPARNTSGLLSARPLNVIGYF